MTKVPAASSSQGSPQAAEEMLEERLTDKVIQQHPRIPLNQPITALCGVPSPALAFELSRPSTTKSAPGITQSENFTPWPHPAFLPKEQKANTGSLP